MSIRKTKQKKSPSPLFAFFSSSSLDKGKKGEAPTEKENKQNQENKQKKENKQKIYSDKGKNNRCLLTFPSRSSLFSPPGATGGSALGRSGGSSSAPRPPVSRGDTAFRSCPFRGGDRGHLLPGALEVQAGCNCLALPRRKAGVGNQPGASPFVLAAGRRSPAVPDPHPKTFLKLGVWAVHACRGGFMASLASASSACVSLSLASLSLSLLSPSGPGPTARTGPPALLPPCAARALSRALILALLLIGGIEPHPGMLPGSTGPCQLENTSVAAAVAARRRPFIAPDDPNRILRSLQRCVQPRGAMPLADAITEARSALRGDLLSGFVLAGDTWVPFVHRVAFATSEVGATWTHAPGDEEATPFPAEGLTYAHVRRWRVLTSRFHHTSDSEEDLPAGDWHPTNNVPVPVSAPGRKELKKVPPTRRQRSEARSPSMAPPHRTPPLTPQPTVAPQATPPPVPQLHLSQLTLGTPSSQPQRDLFAPAKPVPQTPPSTPPPSTPLQSQPPSPPPPSQPPPLPRHSPAPLPESLNSSARSSPLTPPPEFCPAPHAHPNGISPQALAAPVEAASPDDVLPPADVPPSAPCSSLSAASQGQLPCVDEDDLPLARFVRPDAAPHHPRSVDTVALDLAALDGRLRELVAARIYTTRRLNASERDCFAAHVAVAVAGYAVASREERTAMWLRFLSVPRLAVPNIRNRRRLAAAAASAPRPSLLRNELRATAMAREGHLSKAAALLVREEHPPGSLAATRAALHSLHPAGTLPPPHPSDGVPTWVSVDPVALRRAVSRGCRGSSPGPSGWTEELLDAALSSKIVSAELPVMLRDLLNGDISDIVAHHLRAARLIPIPKKDGGVRPIAVGEVPVRIAAALALSSELDHLGKHLLPLQYALSEGGAEAIVHEARRQSNAGATIIAVDFRNAFNTVRRTRIAAEVVAFPRIVRLFDLMYSKASPLLWNGETLLSTEGTRQGDVLGPALFALALQPCLVALHLRFPDVGIYAFMDDVTLMSQNKDSLAGAFLALADAAACIGLRVNTSKTVVFGPLALSLAPLLNISYSDLGLTCLGAFISTNISATNAFLDAAVNRHAKLFAALPRLDPEVAFAVLRFCGWPCLNFLCRVMPALLPQARAFDALVLSSFCRIIGLRDALAAHQLALLQLPLRLGGFGLRSYERLAPECYAASSIRGSNSEAARTRLLDISVQHFVDSSSFWHAHREAVSKRYSTDWLRGPSDFVFKSGDFVRAMQLRLGAAAPWPSTKTLELCRCGVASSTPLSHELHLVSCAVHPGLGPQTRHNAVRNVMAQYLREHGATVSLEPVVANGRADLQVVIPDLGVDTTIDFVISGEVGAARSIAAKARKYRGQSVVTADATVLGGISGRFSKLIRSVTVDSGQRKELRELLGKTIQAMNGKILQRRLPQPVFQAPTSDISSSSDDDDDDGPHRSSNPAHTSSTTYPQPFDPARTSATSYPPPSHNSFHDPHCDITPPPCDDALPSSVPAASSPVSAPNSSLAFSHTHVPSPAQHSTTSGQGYASYGDWSPADVEALASEFPAPA